MLKHDATSHNIFSMMKPFMLTAKNMNKCKIVEPLQKVSILVPKARPPPIEQKSDLEKIQIPVKKSKPVPVKKVEPVLVPVKENPFFYPRQKDSLFWCFFIIKNGFSAYEYPGTTTFVREKELKFEYIDTLRASKQMLKTKKIKNLREDVEDELANKERIGMKTFIALCVASNINVLFIHKRKCFELIFDEEEPIYIVHQKEINKHTKYSLQTDASKDIIQNYRDTYFQWESVDKPLKAPSAYKVEDLHILCKKMDITINGKKKTKKELYDLLLLAI